MVIGTTDNMVVGFHPLDHTDLTYLGNIPQSCMLQYVPLPMKGAVSEDTWGEWASTACGMYESISSLFSL